MSKEKVKFEESETLINLARIFAGECQDGARYQFIAKKAMEEGQAYIQSMLKTLAKNEMAHAQAVYDAITSHATKKISNVNIEAGYPFLCGTLAENIKHSIDVEESEGKAIYPSFAAVARDEGFLDIADLVDNIARVEVEHNKQLVELYTKVKKNSLYKSPTALKWKCSNCGHEAVQKAAWAICPLCSMPQGYVMINVCTK